MKLTFLKDKRVKIAVLALLVLFAAFFCYRALFGSEKSLFGGWDKERVKNITEEKKGKNDSVISIKPANISVKAGDEFSLNIKINPGSHKVSNADVYLTYDKDKLKLDSMDKAEKFDQVLASSMPGDGTASHSAATSFGANISSEASYATLHFRALSPAEKSQVLITSASGIYADDEPGVNELGSKEGCSVHIK